MRAVKANSHEWRTKLIIARRRVAQNKITVVENCEGSNTLFEVPFK